MLVLTLIMIMEGPREEDDENDAVLLMIGSLIVVMMVCREIRPCGSARAVGPARVGLAGGTYRVDPVFRA